MSLVKMAKAYPKAIRPTDPVPLAIGVHKQVGLQISLTQARRTLKRYTQKKAYLEALARPGALRYNLDGSIAGPVSGEHSAKAQKALERRAKSKKKTPAAEA